VGNKPPSARKKLLVGLNMYGAVFTPARRPIKGDEYVRMLEKYEPSLQWDDESEESFWDFTDLENGVTDGEVWYPSLYSIRCPFVPSADISKRLSLIEDLDVGGVSLWELGQVYFDRSTNCQGLDYFYELL
jgi:spore germination protein YaaH